MREAAATPRIHMTTDLYRMTEISDTDPLGTVAVAQLSGLIRLTVSDRNMHWSISTRVARAVADRRISPDELGKLLDQVSAKRAAGLLKCPGAYFLSAARRMFTNAGIQW